MRRLLVFGLLASLVGVAAAQSPGTHQHSFKDTRHWARMFDDPARDEWQRPQEVIRALALAPDAVVADIGAGTGYFASRLAAALERGQVLASDAEPAMAKHLAERAKKEQRTNLVAIAGSPDDPRLPSKVDVALLVNVYHHIGARTDYFRRLQDSLRPGGRVAIIDYTLDSPRGPPKASRMPAEAVIAEMKQAGYALLREHRILPNQYFLEFQPAAR